MVALAAALTVTLLAPRSGSAQAPKPTRKDSSPRTKPKDVVLTPSVTPSEAKPGDTVVYKVTAKLNPGWHIYTYAKEQQGDGPRNTRFDFFDTDGLTVAGDWTASKEATRKKEPAFPDLEFVSFYEDEVTWSIPLKVPSEAVSGKKTLRCQASYQICDAKSCSFPGAWTLPEIVLTVVAGQGAQAQAEGPAPVPAPAAAAAGPEPKKKDTPDRFQPKTVALSATVKPQVARPGETVTYRVTAKLDPGWHIFDYSARQPPTDPRSTLFDFFDTAGLKVAGVWTPDTAPQVKPEPGFDNLLASFFEGEVTWSLPLKVPDDLAPGKKVLRSQVGYQVCDATQCLPQARTTLPDVALTVLPSAEAFASPPTPPGPVVVAAAPETPSAPTGPASVASAPETPLAPPAATAPMASVATVTEAPAATVGGKVVSEVEQTAQRGVIPLMVASALGGLLALVMPCVWPMVPITVNFFVKQGQFRNGRTTALAVTYCLAIIGVFTAVGVLCSFFVSATALPRLANNPWLNFAVAGLFFAFGLSLLGLFEIRLPNALLNASSRGESRGGLIGVVFMALTLTITSFTCTFPVVGGLLVMASTGQFFYPVIGLATFATVLALPFFLLALSPGLLSKVPKSGDWMNAVKVVGGLVEIGAAFKFLNTAELAFVTPENAWFDAQFVLTAWVVLAAVCGFYLLGFFRTDHDHEEVRVGPGRMVLGASFLGLALFLAPALFGRPPQSQIWDRLVVGLLPPDVAELTAPAAMVAGSGGDASPAEEHATDSNPDTAQRQEKRFHGVSWGFSFEQAKERAKAEGKPILIDFTGVNCANCRLMEQNVLPKRPVAALLKKFVTVQLYTDFVPINSITAEQRQALGEKNLERLMDLTNDAANPYYVALSPDGKVLSRMLGYREPDVFIAFLSEALGKLGGSNKVAQAEAAR
jgi:thiol:disulfide interchange protein DsbD